MGRPRLFLVWTAWPGADRARVMSLSERVDACAPHGVGGRRALPLPERAAQVLALRGELTGDRLGIGLATIADPHGVPAWEEEGALTVDMAPERRAEFLIGRLAAHRAIDHAGLSQAPVLTREGRPLFAPQTVGTISHSHGIAVALAATSARYRCVGIDIEFGLIPLRAARLVLGESELRSLAAYGPCWAGRLLLEYFSAKEAAFKALDAILDDGAPPLHLLRLRPKPGGYVCRAVHSARVNLVVQSRPLLDGVLSWTSIRGESGDANGDAQLPEVGAAHAIRAAPNSPMPHLTGRDSDRLPAQRFQDPSPA